MTEGVLSNEVLVVYTYKIATFPLAGKKIFSGGKEMNHEQIAKILYRLTKKLTKQEKAALYDYFCLVADNIIERYDPCGWKRTGAAECLQGRPKGCCHECKYWSSGGCTTNSLGCKLFLCWSGSGLLDTLSPKQIEERSYVKGILSGLRIVRDLLEIPGSVGESKKESFALERGASISKGRYELPFTNITYDRSLFEKE